MDRVLDSVKGTLDAVRANRSLDAETLAACLPPLATALTSHAAAAVTACFWLATQLLLTPVLVTTHAPPLPLLLQSEATAAPGGGSSGSGSGSSSGGLGGSCYSASLHVASEVGYVLLTLGSVGTAAAPPVPPPPPRPEEPSLAPLSHPMLTTWQPRGVVVYVDVGRLNSAAVAVAAGAPADAAPPVGTDALPLLPEAAELLGWSVRHAEEYYHMVAAAAAAAAATAVAAPAGGAAGGLAADPAAVLSEAKLAARIAAEADVVVLSGRLTDAGSMVKWLAQQGVLVLAAPDLSPPAAGVAGGGGGGGGGNGGDAAARELARTMVALLAVHHLQAAGVRALAAGHGGGVQAALASAAAPPQSGAATPRRPGSRAATPRASLSGAEAAAAADTALAAAAALAPPPAATATAAAAAGATAAAGLQPLAALTYLTDVSLAKPVLATAGELGHRLTLSLQALEATFAAAPLLAPHAEMLARHVSRQLGAQRLILEGLLAAPELLRARHPATAPLPGSAAAAGVAAGMALVGVGAGSDAGFVGGDAAGRPAAALHRVSSTGRLRPMLPAMAPKGSTSSRASTGGGPAAGTPPRPPPPATAAAAAAMVAARPPGAPAGAGAYSTESEDEEVGVSRIVPPRAGPSALLPDEPDQESEVASMRSASTVTRR